ncbi:uncharacterized mitochondrial protein AtMg00820-like [Corylus avellana]|uniref:uncharacterized mitochondrial protein AtMg00820-like n=1 Tax=Corylus avellana TaxID=13451 RepID=UPI00286D1C4D|nr:uncharacterized mitochondrial protein AtMg00820-like [Corylus avellana]
MEGLQRELVDQRREAREAIRSENWRQGLNTEFDALLKNNTWTLKPSNSATNVIGCKWVFRVKRKADGSVECYKARLVAKGFHQLAGIDNDETCNPLRFERKARRVGVKGRDRGTPRAADVAESENVDAGVEVLADHGQ